MYHSKFSSSSLGFFHRHTLIHPPSSLLPQRNRPQIGEAAGPTPAVSGQAQHPSSLPLGLFLGASRHGPCIGRAFPFGVHPQGPLMERWGADFAKLES